MVDVPANSGVTAHTLGGADVHCFGCHYDDGVNVSGMVFLQKTLSLMAYARLRDTVTGDLSDPIDRLNWGMKCEKIILLMLLLISTPLYALCDGVK